MTDTQGHGTDFKHAPQCERPDLVAWPGKYGDRMLRCKTCGRAKPFKPEGSDLGSEEDLEPMTPQATVRPHLRTHWLGCGRCGGDMWLDSARPRLPLCDPWMRRGKRKPPSEDLP